MKKNLIGLSALLIMFFSGCASSYQPEGLGGGYQEVQLDEDVFKVSFRGNGYTKRERATDFALLRAGEVTLQNGYKYFAIIDTQNYSKTGTYTTPTTYRTSGNVYGYGNTAYYSGTTYATGGQTFNISKPRSTNTIKCFKKKPNINAQVYNAEFLVKSIKAQYKII